MNEKEIQLYAINLWHLRVPDEDRFEYMLKWTMERFPILRENPIYRKRFYNWAVHYFKGGLNIQLNLGLNYKGGSR